VAEAQTAPVVLISGASRGIGAATARELSAAGCRLMLTARSSNALQQQAAELRASRAIVDWIATDISEPASAAYVVRRTIETFGTISALVCSAGLLHVGSLENATEEEILETLSVNLLAPMRLARETISTMREGRRGRIVFVASTFAYVSAPNYTLYSVSKAGVVGLTKSLAIELASIGVQVNAVAPGQVRTEMIAGALERFGENRIAATIPAGRVGEAGEIAKAIRFLTLDAPDFMTGDVMTVDGGYLCR